MSTSEVSHGGGWFDSHCHLNDLAHVTDVWTDARQHNILQAIVPGTHPDQWSQVTSLTLPGVYQALGTHPWFTQNPEAEALKLQQALEQNNVVAIGEIGLDFYPAKSPRPAADIQLDCFERQLAIAAQVEKPVIIHSVKAHQDVIRLLKHYPSVTGVIHAFSGSLELAQQYLSLGFYLGVGSQLIRSKKFARVVETLPMDQMLLETDAPYMPINKTSANVLLDLLTVANKWAELKQMPTAVIMQLTTSNAQRLFLKDESL